MGAGIVIPLVVLLVAVPAGLMAARKRFKAGHDTGSDVVSASGARLTSTALRALPAPPWRVVYEIADDRLGGVQHVLIGPPGVFALQTSMDALPTAGEEQPSANEVARAAVTRGRLDDALARCAMSSQRLVVVHWGAGADGPGPAVDPVPGVTAVDGRRLERWAASLTEDRLSAAQVDLAWQTVVTAIGRPDPLG